MPRRPSLFLALSVVLAACGSSHGGNVPPPESSGDPDAGTAPAGPLAAPADLHVDSEGPWGIALAWTAVPGASAYEIQAGTDAASLTHVGTANDNAFTFTPVEAGQTYFFRVASSDGTTEGGSSTLSHTLVPAAPANLAVVGGTGSSLDLSWDAVPHATGYVLYRCDSATCTRETETAETHATVSGLAPGSMHNFEVKAQNAGGEGPASTRVRAGTVPPGPAILSFDGETTNSVQVHFELADGADDFVLEVALAEDGPFFPAGSTVSPFTTLTAAGLHPDASYFLRVLARNALGTAAGAARSYQMGAHPYGTGATPPVPPGLALAPGAGSIEVSWTGTFTLYTSVNVLAAASEAGPFVPVAAGSANGHRFSWTHLQPGTRYCVALESVSVEAGGPQFSAASDPVCATTAP